MDIISAYREVGTFRGAAVLCGTAPKRILAMAAAIWHSNNTGQPVTRSLIAHDH